MKRHRREYAPPSCTHKSQPSEGNDCPTEIEKHVMYYYRNRLNSFEDYIMCYQSAIQLVGPLGALRKVILYQ